MLDALATYRENTGDEHVLLEGARATNAGECLIVPYRTLFNAPQRVREHRERFTEAWTEAGRQGYRDATMLTLTTDPSRYDSLLAVADDLREDVSRLRRWHANRFDPVGDGTRSPWVLAVEFTDSGLIHAHVVLFGVRSVPHAVLRHYWDACRDRGEVVWCDALDWDDDAERWHWHRPRHAHRERADRGMRPVASRSPRAYLTKTLDTLAEVASMRPETVRTAARRLRAGEASADDPAHDWWKLACYWALGEERVLSPTDRSPKLAPEADDDDALPYIPRWRFVGVAEWTRYRAISASGRRSSHGSDSRVATHHRTGGRRGRSDGRRV